VSNHPEKKQKLREFRGWIAERLRGQDTVLDAFCAHLLRSEQNLTDQGLPKGGFLCVGPTGVGKTELCVLFAGYFFGPGMFARFDMAEYKELENIAVFRDRVVAAWKEGKRVFLFDEIEKGHLGALDLLLALLSAARMTDSANVTADFSDCYFVMTSNLGASQAMEMRTRNRVAFERTIRYHVESAIKKPEIIARIELVGAILVFDRLGRKEQENVAKVGAAKQLARFAKLGHRLSITDETMLWLVENGTNEKYGARPLLALMSRELEGALGRALIGQPDGASVRGRFVPAAKNSGIEISVEA
jgi:ATP-dependent Clp protease ATP-binding subunit ClpA